MARGEGTQRFPAGALSFRGHCQAPLHDGPRRAERVVEMRFGPPDTGPASPPWDVCRECLADFSVVSIGGLVPFVRAGDGMWHQVAGTLPS